MNGNESIKLAGMVALSRWCRAVGLSSVTAWRFRKRGWLATINIAGRVYVTDDSAAEFARRAAAGEFSRVHPVPSTRLLRRQSP